MAGKKTFESHEDYMRRIRSQPTTPGSTQNSVEVKTGYVYHSMSCKTIQGVADELNKRDMEGWELVSVFWGGGGTFGGNEYGVVVMCSSLGSEYSLESSETKAGFFTLAIVEGLGGKADPRAVSEAFEFPEEKAKREADG